MENSLWMIVDYVIIFEGIVKQFPEFLAVVLKKKNNDKVWKSLSS